MKGLMIIGNNIEDGEAILTRDLLIRAGLEIDLVSIYKDTLDITTAYNLNIKADYKLDQVDLYNYDFLVIPGGMWVFAQLENKDEIVSKLAKNYYEENKLVAAICAAPRYLGAAGLLKGIDYTCFPSSEEGLDGNYLKDKKVVVSNNIITAKGLGAAFEFSYEIIKYLLDENTAKEVLKTTQYI